MNKITKTLSFAVILPVVFCSSRCRPGQSAEQAKASPNILFVIADDQSFPHASAYGKREFHTPNFDRVAENGVLFMNAFVAAPQCSPSRAAILTGRHIWQLAEAGTHSSYFPKKFSVFTDVLEASGYFVGFTGKGWGPGNWKDAGWTRNPAGKEYSKRTFDHVPATGISKVDYASNFEMFLKEKPEGKPFFFWLGSHEPHRSYEYGSGRKAFPEVRDVALPAFLPDDDTVTTDWLDYAREIAWNDEQLGKVLDLLKESGQLANTLVVVTADNGMSFPYAKANLQEYGIHVPLAIAGPGIAGGRRADELVSLIDLTPTFLGIAGAPSMEGMAGRSLLPLLKGDGPGLPDTSRAIFAGRERHTHARPDNTGYPARAMRTSRYLYVWNIKPDRWPAGDPPPAGASQIPGDDSLKPVEVGYEDVDDSPSKRFMLANRYRWPNLYALAFAKRGEEQLYDVQSDPECLHDLASNERYAAVRNELRHRLLQKLTDEGDPRVMGTGEIFDSYPRFGAMRAFPGFHTKGAYNPAFEPRNAKANP